MQSLFLCRVRPESLCLFGRIFLCLCCLRVGSCAKLVSLVFVYKDSGVESFPCPCHFIARNLCLRLLLVFCWVGGCRWVGGLSGMFFFAGLIENPVSLLGGFGGGVTWTLRLFFAVCFFRFLRFLVVVDVFYFYLCVDFDFYCALPYYFLLCRRV